MPEAIKAITELNANPNNIENGIYDYKIMFLLYHFH